MGESSYCLILNIARFPSFQVEGRFESEESRTHHYLSAQTSSPLQEILKKNLLTAHLSDIIDKPNSGLDAMIDSNKIDDLSRLYRLYLMVPEGLPYLRKALKESIERRGTNINRASSGTEIDGMEGGVIDIDDSNKNPVKSRPNTTTQTLALALQWVQEVLDLKDRFDQVWRQAFSRDKDLDNALNTVSFYLCL
jgi:cullin 3